MSALVLAGVAALAAQAGSAAAATTTWTVVNPHANGDFTATAPGLTLERAGKPFISCVGEVKFVGTLASKSSTDAVLGKASSGWTPECTGPGGSKWSAVLSESAAPNYLKAAAYNASTGVATLSHFAPSVFPVWTWLRIDAGGSCMFSTTSVAATYTNATAVLKTTTAKVYDAANCAGTITTGETLTHAATFAVTPAIKITAATS
ncbi:hypothetical protein GCM10022221_28420 [Actinocorallia aurea]